MEALRTFKLSRTHRINKFCQPYVYALTRSANIQHVPQITHTYTHPDTERTMCSAFVRQNRTPPAPAATSDERRALTRAPDVSHRWQACARLASPPPKSSPPGRTPTTHNPPVRDARDAIITFCLSRQHASVRSRYQLCGAHKHRRKHCLHAPAAEAAVANSRKLQQPATSFVAGSLFVSFTRIGRASPANRVTVVSCRNATVTVYSACCNRACRFLDRKRRARAFAPAPVWLLRERVHCPCLQAHA